MSHQHYCDVAGHRWACEGMALRYGDTEPSVCMCLMCDVPLEGFDHSTCGNPVELVACPQHRAAEWAAAALEGAEPVSEPIDFSGGDGNPCVGFCLWCGRAFHSMHEVAAHNADDMRACPAYQELSNRPGGCPCMPPVLQDMPGQAGLLKGPEDGAAPDNGRTGKTESRPTPIEKKLPN
jgi:hypothetical protein